MQRVEANHIAEHRESQVPNRLACCGYNQLKMWTKMCMHDGLWACLPRLLISFGEQKSAWKTSLPSSDLPQVLSCQLLRDKSLSAAVLFEFIKCWQVCHEMSWPPMTYQKVVLSGSSDASGLSPLAASRFSILLYTAWYAELSRSLRNCTELLSCQQPQLL